MDQKIDNKNNLDEYNDIQNSQIPSNNIHDDRNHTFIELEKQFNEIKEFFGNIFQNGTKKIKDSFKNRRNITIDDIDIGSHPVIIEKFSTFETNIDNMNNRLLELESKLNIIMQTNITDNELNQKRYEQMTQLISDNYYNSNKRCDFNNNSIDKLKGEIKKMNNIIEVLNDTRIDPIEDRVETIETSLYEVKNGVEYIMENIDPNQIKKNTDIISKIVSDIDSIKEDNKSLDEKIEEHKNKIEGSIILLD